MPTARSWMTVFTFAPERAGTEIPRRATTDRYPLITASRAAITATGNHQKTLLATSATMAASTRHLSARGSRNAPEVVVPWRRATYPSKPSVPARTIQSANVHHDDGLASTTTRRSGAAASLPRVMALAGVASADCPNRARRVAITPLPDRGRPLP